MSEFDSDNDDWFNKDEKDIENEIKELKAKELESHEAEQIDDRLEYLEAVEPNHSTYMKITSNNNAGGKCMQTSEFRKIVQLDNSLDVFLYVMTYDDEEDFFAVQHITPNDSHERVILYVRILAIIVNLKLPGFHSEILEKFANNHVLLHHLCKIITKLFSKQYETLWKNEEYVDTVLNAVRILLLQNAKLFMQSKTEEEKKGKGSILMQMWQEIRKGDSPVAQSATCIAFKKEFEIVVNNKAYVESEAEATKSNERRGEEMDEVYPILGELVSNEKIIESLQSNCHNNQCTNAADYIKRQKSLLRKDFMLPLHKFVRHIMEAKPGTVPTLVLEKVTIVLNVDFINARRNELVFIDIYGTNRKDVIKPKGQKKHSLWKILQFKTGALLCLSTSKEFNNLILAKVTYTDKELQNTGYIGIEVVRQYNIGNIISVPLLMFETPAFFEPYYNVFTYLNNCCTDSFPMSKYIISNEANIEQPLYMKDNLDYKINGEKFKPLKKMCSKKLPLNEAQRLAYNRALSEELCLIHGPPGTGKTHVLTYILKTLMGDVAKKSTPIILITYTNDSLDKTLLKLSMHTNDIVRFGSDIRIKEIEKYNIHNVVDNSLVNPRMKRLYYAVKLQYKKVFEHLQKLYFEFDGTEEYYQCILQEISKLRQIADKLDCIRCLFQYYVVRGKGLIAMTSTCGAKMNFLFRLLQSHVVVFEEAAELLESHVIACLTPYTQHVIMSGDHLQLQPYTNLFYSNRSNSLNISLFQHLIEMRNIQPAILNIQYRMRPIIAELIYPLIYEQPIRNDDVVNEYPSVRRMLKNLYFFNHTEPEEEKFDNESSFANQFEAAEIVKLTEYLIYVAKYTAKDIVILSPYLRQIELIENQIKEKCKQLKNVQISTVDRFQGLERNIVLLSLVRSFTNDTSSDEKRTNIGFLKEKNRICVALTRAKHGLYIIGNMYLLAKCSTTWKDIQGKLKECDNIGNHFPYECN